VDEPQCKGLHRYLAEQAAISQRQCVCDKNVKVQEKIYTFVANIQQYNKPDFGLRVCTSMFVYG
jgi:hypothetical protein